MSIWVRLIGGPANGQVKKIDDDQSEITIQDRVPLQSSHRHFGLSSITAEVKLARYTRRRLRHVSGGEIIYFALEGVSDWKALRTVLGP